MRNKQRNLLLEGWVILLLICAFRLPAAGQSTDEPDLCGVRAGTMLFTETADTGGRHITARGVLRVLVVFASFPDDEAPHPFWPAHAAPLFMDQFIDPDTATRSQSPFNLTNYFLQMSLGAFHLVGDAIWVESLHSQEEYRNGSYGRANTDILRKSVDSLVDFTPYDQWTKLADFSHSNTPDGLVDMILMVWRTNMFEYLGEASLGYKPGFVVDGKRIEMGFPEYLPLPLGSGVTVQYIYTDSPRLVMQTMAHELGHWLLGGPHPYNGESPQGKHMYWGILCNGLRASSCMNAYERERLGWIVVPELPPDVDVALPDFLSSGVAYKFRPPNGEPVEYFYLENHQLLSIFDDVTVNPADKGLWILHQQGPYMELDNLKIKPSDGNWEWSTPGTTTACSTTPLPVFKREAPCVATGVSHRSQIPIATSAVNWMRSFQDSAGQLNCGAFFKGEKFTGAFSSGGGAVFSAYSNPGTNAWSNIPSGFAVEVGDESSGTLIIRRNLDPLDGSPARRYLGLNPATGGRTGSLHLAWGDQWPDGQPVEADVQWSEVQRRVGLDGIWTTLFDGNAMSMWDESMAYDSSGTVQVFFRVRVRDTQGKYSTWSNVHTATALAPTTMEDALQLHDPWQGGLLAMNYPNPFNPSTTITYRVPEKGRVTLGVCDLLGRHIRLLVDEEKSPGNLSASWDGTDNEGRAVGGGIYFYSIRTGRSALTKKMLLLR